MVILTIIVAGVLIGSTSIGQSYAAKKISETNEVSGPFVIGDFPICGTTTQLEIILDVHSIYWDNDKYIKHITATLTATDSNGEIIGKGTDTDMATGTTTNSLDHTFQHKYQVICRNGAPNENVHEGYTLHKDGSVSLHHE